MFCSRSPFDDNKWITYSPVIISINSIIEKKDKLFTISYRSGTNEAHTIKIDGAGAVLVNFGDDTVQIIGSQFIVKLVQNFPQSGCRNVSIA